ncbi:MAG: phosphatidate cytidylyltransferase [Bdellovibrionota bacterium]
MLRQKSCTVNPVLTRIKTACVLMAAVLVVIALGGWWLKLLLLAVHLQINYELLGFYPFSERRRRALAVLTLGLPLGFLFFGLPGALSAMLLYTVLGLVTEVIAAESAQHELEHLGALSLIALTLAYTGLFGTSMVIGVSSATRDELLFVFFSVVAADSCAYFAGRAFGGPKMSPRISPKKTVSGGIGGLIGAAICGGICAAYLNLPFQWFIGGAVGLVVGVLAIFGDLVESLVKRAYGVKDSGSLLPGHGGLLDRVDALIFVSPVLFVLRAWSGL